VVGNSSFYHAGEMGMDMIIEVFKFASKALKKNGHLLILTPSVSPSSIAFDTLKGLGLYARPAKALYVRLRKHLTDRIKSWVDNNKIKYPEMRYHEKDGKFYEKVNLHSVHFVDNINRDDVDGRFFKGFEYTIETLPEDVISCTDAATAKMIPLQHELKSLVLKTGKGLYVLSLMGSASADFRAVKRILGTKEASMASEEELYSLGLKKGAVCPVLQILWNMPQLLSTEVFELDYVSTNAGKLNECIIFNPRELLKHRELITGEFSREGRDAYNQEVIWIG
jgi:prolyl-tRNA editing enzyme YbaK/EbsC (Cys-tRNA(Pro) deacylase)